MRLLAKQPIVVGMTADPEPDESIGRFDSQSSVNERRLWQTRTGRFS
jgi:hypothetical protein